MLTPDPNELKRRLSRIVSDVWGTAPPIRRNGETVVVEHPRSPHAVRMEPLRRAVPLDTLPEGYAVSALQSPCDVLYSGAVVLQGVPYMHAVHAVRALTRCDAGPDTLQATNL